MGAFAEYEDDSLYASGLGMWSLANSVCLDNCRGGCLAGVRRRFAVRWWFWDVELTQVVSVWGGRLADEAVVGHGLWGAGHACCCHVRPLLGWVSADSTGDSAHRPCETTYAHVPPSKGAGTY